MNGKEHNLGKNVNEGIFVRETSSTGWTASMPLSLPHMTWLSLNALLPSQNETVASQYPLKNESMSLT